MSLFDWHNCDDFMPFKSGMYTVRDRKGRVFDTWFEKGINKFKLTLKSPFKLYSPEGSKQYFASEVSKQFKNLPRGLISKSLKVYFKSCPIFKILSSKTKAVIISFSSSVIFSISFIA